MTIENEEERKEDFERRRKEEAAVSMLAQLQEKQDDESAMLLGNIKHKVILCKHQPQGNITYKSISKNKSFDYDPRCFGVSKLLANSEQSMRNR